MSDCFDHACDAWDRHLNGDDDYYPSRGNYNYDRDPDYYFSKRVYFSSCRPVGSAYQIFFSDGSWFYVPKSLVRQKTDSMCKIHGSFKINRQYPKGKEPERATPTIPWEEAQYYL